MNGQHNRLGRAVAVLAVSAAVNVGLLHTPVHAASNTINMFTYASCSSGTPPTPAQKNPIGLAVAGGYLYLADSGNAVVCKVQIGADGRPSGLPILVAGTYNVPGTSGDGGQATSAQLTFPTGVAVDSIGNVFIADNGADVVREVLGTGAHAGTIITFADGTNTMGSDGSFAPYSVVVGTGGTLLFSAITTDNSGSLSGDIYRGQYNPSDGSRTVDSNTSINLPLERILTGLNGPQGIVLDAADNLFVGNFGDNTIDRITAASACTAACGMTEVAQIGNDYTVDNLAVDGSDTLYVVSSGYTPNDPNANFYSAKSQVRIIANANTTTYDSANPDPSTPYAGNGTQGFTGDGGGALSAELSAPQGVAVTGIGPSSEVFIADTGNDRVRDVMATTTAVPACPSDVGCSDSSTATPELGSGELLATGLAPILGMLLYRRQRAGRTTLQVEHTPTAASMSGPSGTR